MTRRKIIFISVPLILLILGVCGFLYIRSDSFLNNFIKPRLEKALENQIAKDYKVILGELSGNIFTGVEVENFTIEQNKAEKLTILSTKKIVLKYHFFGLLRRKFLVTALEIDSPEVNLQRNPDGQVNLTQVFQESLQDSDASFTFAVSKAAINDGKILFTDTQQNIELELPNIKLGLKGPLDDWDHSGTISFGDGSLIINGTKLPIDRVKEIAFSVSKTGGDLQEHKLKLGNSVLTLSGNWDGDAWDANAKLSLNAADVQTFLDGNIQLEGLGEVALDLKGTNSTLNGTINAEMPALSIKQITESITRQIDIKNLNIDTNLDFDEVPKIGLDDFSVQVADGKLTGSGSATFDNTSEGNLIKRLQHIVKQPIAYKSKWEVENIQLNSLLSMFVELPAETPQIESGMFTGSAQISGSTTQSFLFDSSVKLSETSLLAKDETIPLKDSSLNLEISSKSENGSSVHAKGTIDEANVDIDGSLENIDVQLGNVDFGKIARIFNTVPFKGVGNITAQISKDGSATGDVEIPEAFYCHEDDPIPIPIGRLAGSFRYIDRIVSFENTYLTKEGGTSVSIEGSVKLEGNLPAKFRIVAAPLVLNDDYNKLFFTEAYPIEGNIKGELNLYGHLIDELDGRGNFSIDSGKAWGINLDRATLPLEIDDYSLTIPNFVITTSGQQVTFNAHVTNTGDFEFSLKNNKNKPIQLAELARAAEVTDFPLDGKMDINLVSHQKKSQNLVFTTEFNFSDLTFEGNPLGDAKIHGTLIEQENHFKFIGKALAGTGSIEGTISNDEPNPYKFTLKCEKTAATPILRIFHPAFDVVSGTIDGTVEVEGTIAELNSTAPIDPAKKRVYPYDADIIINQTQLQYNALRFTNPKPIRLKLEQDILTITESSLSVDGEKSPFIELLGTIDAKAEKIDIFSKQNQHLSLESFGTALELAISGAAQYNLQVKGTFTNPIVDLKWAIPTLVVKTDVGDIGISDADGEITFQNNNLLLKPFSLQVLGNPLQIGGNIAINQNEFNNSRLNFNISGNSIDLGKFSDLFRNSIPVETLKRLTSDKSTLIEGNLGLLLNVAGTIAEPVLDLKARTTENRPIYFGAFAKPITLDKLHAVTSIKKQSMQIRNLVANGQIGGGNFHINGTTSFSTQNKDEITFDMDLSVEKLEVGDFTTLFQQQQFPLKGTVSATTKLTGTGFTSNLIAATCKIDELNLQAHNYQISNASPISFNLNNNIITALFVLQVKSPAIETDVNISFDGPFTNPNILMKWQGTINPPLHDETDLLLQWQGEIEYVKKQIKLGIELTNNGDALSLNGTIPFDLTFSKVDFLDRFIDAPINVQLTGKELPLTFFPGVDAICAEVTGVADIDLTLKGTTASPYLQGDVSLEVPKILFKKFDQPLERVNVQLKVNEDVIELAKFQFAIEDGTCNLNQSELKLDGLMPKLLSVNGSLKNYPLGSTLRQAIPEDTLTEVSGQVSATLADLEISFDRFFENGEKVSIPTLREPVTFDALTQEADAEFSIDDISFGFVALDKKYNFNNPEPIPISLNSGEFIVKELKLKNTGPIVPNTPENPLIFTCFGRWNMQDDMVANLKLEHFNISAIEQLFSKEFRDAYELTGMLSSEINISGAYAAPNVTVQLDGHKLRINQADVDKFGVELRYSHNERQWKIPDNTEFLRIGNNRLICSGRVPFLLSFSNLQAEPLLEEMEVKIDFRMADLGVLPRIQRSIQTANGKGTINATIRGTPKAPQLVGTGEFNEVDLKLAYSPVSVEDAKVEFDFTESRIGIGTVEGKLNDGTFSAKGEMDTNWLRVDNINFNGSLTECVFIQPGQYEANISSGANGLHLYGDVNTAEPTLTELILTGDVIIHSGYYEQNWEIIRDWFSGGTVSEAQLAFSSPFLRNFQLDVGIEISDNFHFRSSLGGSTDIKIGCREGRLIGLIQEPNFIGEISLLEGEISIFPQIFEIVEDSTINNQDDSEFNPVLNISLQLPNPIRGVLLRDGGSADVMVSATVTGTLKSNRLSFTGVPLNSTTTEVFSEADVIALLSPRNSFLFSYGGFVFTLSVFDPNERHIIAEYPLPFGENMSIKVEGDEKGEFGVDLQLLERRF